MITWPLSPMLPPPIARRSTPRAASASARVAIAPGSFFNSTTNCLAMCASRVGRAMSAILAGDGSLVRRVRPSVDGRAA